MGFIQLPVSETIVQAAKDLRAERDQRYGNIFEERESDWRWSGEVGELLFNQWAKESFSAPLEWITEDAAGKADFVLDGLSIGMKTVKRQVPIKPGYTAQITAKHAEEPVDYFLFASYEFPKERLWLLGVISRSDFLKKATYYPAGSQVHANYTIRPGHEIFNIEIAKLTPMLDGLRAVIPKNYWNMTAH